MASVSRKKDFLVEQGVREGDEKRNKLAAERKANCKHALTPTGSAGERLWVGHMNRRTNGRVCLSRIGYLKHIKKYQKVQ